MSFIEAEGLLFWYALVFLFCYPMLWPNPGTHRPCCAVICAFEQAAWNKRFSNNNLLSVVSAPGVSGGRRHSYNSTKLVKDMERLKVSNNNNHSGSASPSAGVSPATSQRLSPRPSTKRKSSFRRGSKGKIRFIHLKRSTLLFPTSASKGKTF